MNNFESKFLAIFSHRYDYIFAFTPQDEKKPKWKTKKRCISDQNLIKFWKDEKCLIGVGFDKNTSYLMLDIDKDSIYHPKQDPDGIKKIKSCLEDLGLCRSMLIQSSYSEGIHLYYPLAESVETFALADLITDFLQTNGFTIKNATLEVFPNPKSYVDSKKWADWHKYNAHRLPLQKGSYLLEDDFTICEQQGLEQFLKIWELCANHQDLSELKNLLSLTKNLVQESKESPSVSAPTTTKSKKFLNDLNETINRGWTDFHQTNYILRRIGAKGVVFEGLGGKALIDYMEEVATSLNGYNQFCRHQHEIRKRCRDWQKFCDKHYTPMGYKKAITTSKPKNGLTNQQKKEQSLEHIKTAITELKNRGMLPTAVKARVLIITQAAECSSSTLYKYKELWHPDFDENLNQKIVCNSSVDEQYSDCYTPLLNELLNREDLSNKINSKKSTKLNKNKILRAKSPVGGQKQFISAQSQLNQGFESNLTWLLNFTGDLKRQFLLSELSCDSDL